MATTESRGGIGSETELVDEIRQRTAELSQWMDRGGKTRRGFYLAPALKELIDGLGDDTPGIDEGRMALDRFAKGYTSTKAALAIFAGEIIDEESPTGRLMAPYLRSLTEQKREASNVGYGPEDGYEDFRWI